MKKTTLLLATILSFNCLFANEILEAVNPKVNDTTLTIKSVNFYKAKSLIKNPLFNTASGSIIATNNTNLLELNKDVNTTVNTTSKYPTSQSINAKEDYISLVQVNDLYNNTLNKTITGYSDFSSLVANISKYTSPTISILRHTNNNEESKSIRVWIDFNQDGDFNDKNETVLLNDNAALKSKFQLTIPSDAKLGKTKMRISLKHGDLPKSSETFTYGEVEDYTINITNNKTSVTNNLNNLRVVQPTDSENITLDFGKTLSKFSVSIYDTRGRLIYNSSIKNLTTNTFFIENLSKISNGSYQIKVTDLETNETITKKLIK